MLPTTSKATMVVARITTLNIADLKVATVNTVRDMVMSTDKVDITKDTVLSTHQMKLLFTNISKGNNSSNNSNSNSNSNMLNISSPNPNRSLSNKRNNPKLCLPLLSEATRAHLLLLLLRPPLLPLLPTRLSRLLSKREELKS